MSDTLFLLLTTAFVVSFFVNLALIAGILHLSRQYVNLKFMKTFVEEPDALVRLRMKAAADLAQNMDLTKQPKPKKEPTTPEKTRQAVQKTYNLP